jgi:hypothetical protein
MFDNTCAAGWCAFSVHALGFCFPKLNLAEAALTAEE